MKTHARAVVIGGGVVGASVLYHLAKAGWTDIVLIERNELTSGSTWHAAGGMHTLNGDPNVAKLQEYTINLYREIEEASGQSCSIHITAGVDLAGTKERLDFLKLACARARYLGLGMEMISVDEAARIFPLMDKKHFVGALYNPLEGHVDPAGVTQAYTKAARNKGAEVYRFTRVTALEPRADGGWDVITDKGTIVAEHVVNAAGLWAREVGQMVGLELPVLAMEHQYIVTGDMPEVIASEKEVLHCIDFEGEIYMRQEGRGMLIGTYEKKGVPWAEKSTPWDFSHELLPPDLERIAPSLEVGFRHFPALERAGIKRIVNGPFTFAPDGNPVMGPDPRPAQLLGRRRRDGGLFPGRRRRARAVELDGPRRSGLRRLGDGRRALRRLGHARIHQREGARELFAALPHPLPERGAARRAGAADDADLRPPEGEGRGVRRGVRARARAVVRAPRTAPVEDVTYRRSNAHQPVGAECRGVRNGVGILDSSTFSRYEVTGPGAAAWLDRMLAGRLPAEGRLALNPMLNDRGRLIGDFTVAREGRGHFFVFGSGIAEQYHLRWFESHLPASGVALRSLRTGMLGLAIAGPKARELLSRVCRDDVSDAAFPFLAFRALEVAMVPARVGRISFTGELGYEIWMPADGQLRVYEALVEAGADLGLVHFGARALQSLRLEKSFGTWAREFRPNYTPTEAGLDRFVDLGKPGLIGGAAAQKARTDGSPRRLVTFVVDAARRRRDRRRARVARRQGRRLDHLGRLRALRRQVDRDGYVPARARGCRGRFRDRDAGRTAGRGARGAAAVRPGGQADAVLNRPRAIRPAEAGRTMTPGGGRTRAGPA